MQLHLTYFVTFDENFVVQLEASFSDDVAATRALERMMLSIDRVKADLGGRWSATGFIMKEHGVEAIVNVYAANHSVLHDVIDTLYDYSDSGWIFGDIQSI